VVTRDSRTEVFLHPQAGEPSVADLALQEAQRAVDDAILQRRGWHDVPLFEMARRLGGQATVMRFS
jgi:hypothetical protein